MDLQNASQKGAALPPLLHNALNDWLEDGEMELPLLPDVATKVIQATQNENTSPKDLAELIKRDQAMAAHILRVANSSLFASAVPIVSLQQAVSRMGFFQLREMALLIACKSKIFDIRGFEKEVSAMFRHSLGAAIYAQNIARIRKANVEEAFMCGLLHDIGRPVVLQKIADLDTKLGVIPTSLAIKATLDQHHAKVGMELAQRWALPERLGLTILHHHDATPPDNVRDLAFTTQLADELSRLAVDDPPLDEGILRAHPAIAALNLYSNDVDGLIKQRDSIKQSVDQLA